MRASGDVEETVRSLLEEGVAFSACANTLAARELDGSGLVSDVETVPEGAVEATRLQEEGYAYLRPWPRERRIRARDRAAPGIDDPLPESSGDAWSGDR